MALRYCIDGKTTGLNPKKPRTLKRNDNARKWRRPDDYFCAALTGRMPYGLSIAMDVRKGIERFKIPRTTVRYNSLSIYLKLSIRDYFGTSVLYSVRLGEDFRSRP